MGVLSRRRWLLSFVLLVCAMLILAPLWLHGLHPFALDGAASMAPVNASSSGVAAQHAPSTYAGRFPLLAPGVEELDLFSLYLTQSHERARRQRAAVRGPPSRSSMPRASAWPTTFS